MLQQQRAPVCSHCCQFVGSLVFGRYHSVGVYTFPLLMWKNTAKKENDDRTAWVIQTSETQSDEKNSNTVDSDVDLIHAQDQQMTTAESVTDPLPGAPICCQEADCSGLHKRSCQECSACLEKPIKIDPGAEVNRPSYNCCSENNINNTECLPLMFLCIPISFPHLIPVHSDI